MVSRFYFKCPSCGTVYQLKIQWDRNAFIYDWPICVECKNCGDNIKYSFNKNGLFPNNTLSPKLISSIKSSTVIGYSSSLPITDEIYMKELNDIESMMLFSPFMNIQQGHFSIEEISQYNDFLSIIQENFLPYRDSVKMLLPILKKGNLNAYSKKMASIFGMKRFKPIDDAKMMHSSFWELIEKSYINLTIGAYSSKVNQVYYKRLADYIDSITKDDAVLLKEALDESGKLSVWYKEESLPYIANFLSSIPKFFPALIFTCTGVFDVNTRGPLKIVTISSDDAANNYSDGYEIFAHGLKIIVGITNVIENRSVDTFTNQGMKGITSITQFAKLPTGLMEDKLSDYTSVYEYVCGTMNRKVRNAASHSGIKYDSETQTVTLFYDPKDDSKFARMPLIELCHITIIQFFHIVEMSMLARKIVEKCE